MDVNPMILEVDGSLRNSSVAWAIGLWSTTLVVLAVVAARRYRYSREIRLTALAALLAVATPIFVYMIAALFYVLPAGSIVSVHFWGMTRFQWLGPVVALFVFLVIAFMPQRDAAAV